MADPLVEAAVRGYADFAEHATLAEVPAFIARCRQDLDTPNAAALPELIERLARHRLADRLSPKGDPADSANGAPGRL
jgi:hypothetical protein